jgi:hypothetical protein
VQAHPRTVLEVRRILLVYPERGRPW